MHMGGYIKKLTRVCIKAGFAHKSYIFDRSNLSEMDSCMHRQAARQQAQAKKWIRLFWQE